jgi:hypothetical protein
MTHLRQIYNIEIKMLEERLCEVRARERKQDSRKSGETFTIMTTQGVLN